MSLNETALYHLLAKEEIREVIYRYCRSVDRMDWDSVSKLYHPDAIDDHGLYRGPVDGFIDFFRRWAGEQYQVAMHLIGNILVTLEDGAAVAESYSITYLRMSSEKANRPEFRRLFDESAISAILEEAKGGSIDLTLGLRMVDRFEQRTVGGPWLIAHRVIVHEWNKLEPVKASLNISSSMQTGRRDQDDLIFVRLMELGRHSK